MSADRPTVTYLELRESTPEGEASAGLSHSSKGLVLLHVQELAAAGEPRGAVTFLHDAGEHGGRGLPLARALAARGWAVALPDLRGHGLSEGPRGHSNGLREVLRDIGDVQDHLAYRQPEAPKVLVGQGLGAIWALSFALERRGEVAALVLLAPLFEPRFELPGAGGGLLGLFKKVGPQSPGRIGWSAAQLSHEAGEQAARAADPQVHDVITLRAGQQAAEAAARARARVSELQLPVLIVSGGADALSPVEHAAGLRAARLEHQVLGGAAHDLLHERRTPELLELVGQWVDRSVPRH